MTCLEKRNVSQKVSMQPLSYLDSFMDETDREVMNLTDRAFKSLCIGDEAIYNDSGLSPSPVDWQKPLVGQTPKKTHDKALLDVKKHGPKLPNGFTKTSWHVKNSFYNALRTEKNDNPGLKGGDKSALVNIQKEISEFSFDCQYHNEDKHLYHDNVQSNASDDTGKRSCTETARHEKSSKNKPSKSNKLRKLNSKNFFLHSEFSPFRCWRALNKLGLETMNIFPNIHPAEFYAFHQHKGLTTINNCSYFPKSESEEMDPNILAPNPTNEPQPKALQQSAMLRDIPFETERNSTNKLELHTGIPQPPQIKQTSSGFVQRCQSDGDLSAPWRKNRARAKDTVQPTVSLPFNDRSRPGDESAVRVKKDVKTMEEVSSSSSTPFSISQLLTPVIPSRQGTGCSEIVQAVFSPRGVELSQHVDSEMVSQPSPEFKREGYKSMASSLLFNLKDNRKRVKTMYSPAKFKGLEPADLNKLSPLTDKEKNKSQLNVPARSDTKSTSPQSQGCAASPVVTNVQCSPSIVKTNESFPDDFLALSLLQDGNTGSSIHSSRSKGNKPVKAAYPSLNLYQKSTSTDFDSNPLPVLDFYSSVDNANKSPLQQKQGKDFIREKNCTDVQRGSRVASDKMLVDNKDLTVTKYKHSPTALTKKCTRQDDLVISCRRSQDKTNKGEKGRTEQNSMTDKVCAIIESKPKHFFSDRQNDYIKSQRYVNPENDNNYECDWDEQGSNRRTVEGHIEQDMGYSKLIERKINDFTSNNFLDDPKNDLDTCSPPKAVKNNVISMRGNTSAKIALFALKEQVLKKNEPVKKIPKIVTDTHKHTLVDIEENAEEQAHRVPPSLDNDDKRSGGENIAPKGKHKQKETSRVRRGQKAISDFKPTCQNVQSMPDRDTKHGECHVAEVNLAEPYKQEGPGELRHHAAVEIKDPEISSSTSHSRQLNTDTVKLDDGFKFIRGKNVDVLKEISVRDNNSEKDSTGQCAAGAVQDQSEIYKQEVPYRLKSHSQSDFEANVEKESKKSRGIREGRSNKVNESGPADALHVLACKETIDEGYNGLCVKDYDGLMQEEKDIEHKSMEPKITVGAPDVGTPKENPIKIKDTVGVPSARTPTMSLTISKDTVKVPLIETPRISQISSKDRLSVPDIGISTKKPLTKMDTNSAPKLWTPTINPITSKDAVSVPLFRTPTTSPIKSKDTVVVPHVRTPTINSKTEMDIMSAPKLGTQTIDTLTSKNIFTVSNATSPTINPITNQDMVSVPNVRTPTINSISSKDTESVPLIITPTINQITNEDTVSDPLIGTPTMGLMTSKDTVSVPDIKTSRINTTTSSELENTEVSDTGSELCSSNKESESSKINTLNNNYNQEDDNNDLCKPEKTVDQLKCKSHDKIFTNGFLDDLCAKSNAEMVTLDKEHNEEMTSKTLAHADSYSPSKVLVNKITIHDILKDDDTSILESDDKPSGTSNRLLSSKTNEPYVPSKCDLLIRCKENLNPSIAQDFSSTPESKHNNSDLMAFPTSEVGKSGWVHCLKNSASNLTPTCLSNMSSPTMGKPVLFKVKDNTFSVSPVTKTVRPILHKTLTGSQPWSPRESWSGSERGEDDPELFKDCLEAQSPIPNSCYPSLPVQPSPVSQVILNSETKDSINSYVLPEEEEWRSAVSSFSEGQETCGPNAGDVMQKPVLNTAPTESNEESKAPSERSESVCSGNETPFQGKPPAVPPKTEKALRRAMKLTTRRLQKAEAKSKSERGRNSEKGVNQKRERRHHSSDKVLSCRSNPREENTKNDEKLLDTSERQTDHRENSNPEKDSNRKAKQGRHGNNNGAENCNTVKPCKVKGHFSGQNGSSGERLGRKAESYLPDKVFRRAQSLDRFPRDKQEQSLLSTECLMNNEPMKMFSIAQGAPLHLNSSDPPSTVIQSFPVTQRRLLQDPDSGRYFVVDMPVQIKTKTFLDPETGNYVQLPVQSLESSTQSSQAMNVNTPPLVLYHGFVPLQVPSLTTNSAVKGGSVSMTEYLDVFESSEDNA